MWACSKQENIGVNPNSDFTRNSSSGQIHNLGLTYGFNYLQNLGLNGKTYTDNELMQHTYDATKKFLIHENYFKSEAKCSKFQKALTNFIENHKNVREAAVDAVYKANISNKEEELLLNLIYIVFGTDENDLFSKLEAFQKEANSIYPEKKFPVYVNSLDIAFNSCIFWQNNLYSIHKNIVELSDSEVEDPNSLALPAIVGADVAGAIVGAVGGAIDSSITNGDWPSGSDIAKGALVGGVTTSLAGPVGRLIKKAGWFASLF